MCAEPEGAFVSANSTSISINPEVQKWFNSVDFDHSGKISTKELQAALINAQGRNFSEEACRLMVTLFDHDRDGSIDIQEFQSLDTYIKQWSDVFKAYDTDGSGYIEEQELLQALNQMGYRLSLDFVRTLLECSSSYGTQSKRMSLDDFVVACVKIQRLTNAFRLRDANMKGMISLSFEDFVEIVLHAFL